MAKNNEANEAENNDIKNAEEQPSNTPNESDGNQNSNQDGNQDGITRLTRLLSWVRKKTPGIATSAIGVILGFIAAWKGFGQWWFGFRLSAWVLIAIAVALNIVWLTAVCAYLAGLEKNKPKLPRLNTVFMIALPALVLGILFGYFAIRWRLSDKIVILVEPFEEIGGVQDGNDSGKELEGIAETIKSELDRAIQEQEKRLNERLDVRVVLGKRHEQELSEEAQLEERALKYRADMVISGWYVERGVNPNKEFLVCPKFQVVRVPKRLPEVFRARSSFYPETMVVSEKEIENLNMNFTLKFAKQLTYEPTLVLGAGAYASRDWKTAQHFFGRALQEIKKIESPEKGTEKERESSKKDPETKVESLEKEFETKIKTPEKKSETKVVPPEKESETKVESTEREPETKVKQSKKESETKKNEADSTENENLKGDANTVFAAKGPESSEKECEAKKRDKSFDRHKYIEGDKALLHLYIGHCLMKQSQYENAILQYDDAIEAGKKIPKSDMRYGEILASAYLARGVAYRQVNAFELARQDFETAGGHLPTSLGLRTMRVEQARFLSGDREKLLNSAEKYYSRGENYLIQREYKHAQAYLEMSVEFYRMLMRGMPRPTLEEYSLGLAESLVRLGEIQNRRAKPTLRGDENTRQAIEHLEEADRLTRRFSDQKDRNMLEIRADGLRHLGEAYKAQDQNDVVEKAIDYHKKAEKIWLELENEKRNNTEEERARSERKAAGERTRIGNVHRRLDDLDPNSSINHLQNAECAYKKAIEKLGGGKYLKILYPVSNDHQVDVNEAKKIKKNLLCETTKKIIIHHLAHTACNLAETHIKQFLAESAQKEPNDITKEDPNNIRIACELLEHATRCYSVAVTKLHDEEDPNWIERIRNEERNLDMRDDLAWCKTLYGYALIKRGPPVDPKDTKHYKEVSKILTEAKKCFSELRDVDVNQGHRILNLFALTASQIELNTKKEAHQTFLEACLLLRRLTREEKKVWYVDYVCDILDKLIESEFQVSGKPEDDIKNFCRLKTWLKADTVREGRQALDKIIKSMDNKVNKSGEVDG